ncbi:hypothetical protein E2C01_066362 [Portunus trituberculatus]|uniref:Uncharacterized protein n=1 Tax=Portunus trituberculatus TaxID=210409 RepID=A0A5B7HQQ9_PORTR|nr:hypothetical protein [Portunus trituberculatus]
MIFTCWSKTGQHSQSPPARKSLLLSGEAQPTLGPWTGFEPVRFETPRTPKRAWFHYTTAAPFRVFLTMPQQKTGEHILVAKTETPQINPEEMISKLNKITSTTYGQWNHACFGIRGVSKRTGSNPVHSPSCEIMNLQHHPKDKTGLQSVSVTTTMCSIAG